MQCTVSWRWIVLIQSPKSWVMQFSNGLCSVLSSPSEYCTETLCKSSDGLCSVLSNLLIDYTLYIIEILGNGIFQEQIYRNIISCRIAWRNFSLNNPTVYCIVHANYLVQYTDVFHNVLQPTVQDIGVLCRLV